LATSIAHLGSADQTADVGPRRKTQTCCGAAAPGYAGAGEPCRHHAGVIWTIMPNALAPAAWSRIA